MPFTESIPYQAPGIAMAAAGNVAGDIRAAMDIYRKSSAQTEANKGAFDALAGSNQLPPGELANALQNFNKWSPDKQSGWLVTKNAEIKHNQDAKEAQALADYRAASLGNALAIANIKSAAQEPTAFDPVTDETGQVVPGKVAVRKTGQVITTGGPQYVYDQKSGNAIGIQDGKGNVKFWNPKTGLLDLTTPVPDGSIPAEHKGLLGRIKDVFSPSEPAPAPVTAPAPVRTSPIGPVTAPVTADPYAAARAAVQQGANVDAVKQRLQQAGLDPSKL